MEVNSTAIHSKPDAAAGSNTSEPDNDHLESNSLELDVAVRSKSYEPDTTTCPDSHSSEPDTDPVDVRRGIKRRWTSAKLAIFSKKLCANLINKTMASSSELKEAQSELPDCTTAQIRVRLNNIILCKQKIVYD